MVGRSVLTRIMPRHRGLAYLGQIIFRSVKRRRSDGGIPLVAPSRIARGACVLHDPRDSSARRVAQGHVRRKEAHHVAELRWTGSPARALPAQRRPACARQADRSHGARAAARRGVVVRQPRRRRRRAAAHVRHGDRDARRIRSRRSARCRGCAASSATTRRRCTSSGSAASRQPAAPRKNGSARRPPARGSTRCSARTEQSQPARVARARRARRHTPPAGSSHSSRFPCSMVHRS